MRVIFKVFEETSKGFIYVYLQYKSGYKEN